MSATNRGAARVGHDFYPTQEPVTQAIAPKVAWSRVNQACEPCVGSGAIPAALAPWYGGPWATFEIREGRDYLAPGRHEPADLALTNPPYNLALDFLKKSLDHCSAVLYLLRISFHGSEERKDFLSENRPTHQYTLSKRPSFVDVCAGFEKPVRVKGCGAVYQKVEKVSVCPACGGKVKAGTDATEYAWLGWDRGGIMLDKPGMYYL